MYFNYHAKVKKLIKEKKLTNYYIVEKYNKISPALILVFGNFVMPIREHKWDEYIKLINETYK